MIDILNMPGLTPGAVTESEQSIAIRVLRRPNRLPGCTHCGSVTIAPNGSRLVSYADLPIRGKPVTIEWERQRFKCKEALCGKTSSDEHPDLHPDFQMTRRLQAWIGNRCLTVTFAEVAADVGLDERTVRRVFEQYTEETLRSLSYVTPQVLGIDEVHLLHAARGVLTNIGARALLDLLPNRNQETMARRIQQMPNRDHVLVVAMDMWQPYRRIAANLLPQATVVVDKWHVTKYADSGMETIRKRHKEGLTPQMRRRLVKDRFLLLKRGHNLSPEQRMIMQTWTHHFPDLAAAYEAKEAFYAIYDSPDRATAEAAFDAWEGSLTQPMRNAFKELLSATRNWREPIFNYFDRRVTNAYTEAINGLVKITNRNGRGYSFDVLRAKMLLRFNGLTPDRSLYQTKGAPIGTNEVREHIPWPRWAGISIATLTKDIEEGHLFSPSTEIAG